MVFYSWQWKSLLMEHFSQTTCDFCVSINRIPFNRLQTIHIRSETFDNATFLVRKMIRSSLIWLIVMDVSWFRCPLFGISNNNWSQNVQIQRLFLCFPLQGNFRTHMVYRQLFFNTRLSIFILFCLKFSFIERRARFTVFFVWAMAWAHLICGSSIQNSNSKLLHLEWLLIIMWEWAKMHMKIIRQIIERNQKECWNCCNCHKQSNTREQSLELRELNQIMRMT